MEIAEHHIACRSRRSWTVCAAWLIAWVALFAQVPAKAPKKGRLGVGITRDQHQPETQMLHWKQLPSLPFGISGHYVGISNGALMIAGGSYFPVSYFTGGKKVWLDSVSVLEPGSREWRTVFHLPGPVGSGASVSWHDEVICIGGTDRFKAFQQVVGLRIVGGQVHMRTLPSLPRPLSMMSAALVGDSVFVVGGQESPSAPTASRRVWMLDLSHANSSWAECPPLPGPGRILPVVASAGRALYVFSGADLFASATGEVTRRYLNDAWRFQPNLGWSKLPDLVVPVTGAPAFTINEGTILVLGGDDGTNVAKEMELKDKHPGFSHTILAFDTRHATWSLAGGVPEALVTTTAVNWRNMVVIVGGEDRPGHRSANVWASSVSLMQ